MFVWFHRRFSLANSARCGNLLDFQCRNLLEACELAVQVKIVKNRGQIDINICRSSIFSEVKVIQRIAQVPKIVKVHGDVGCVVRTRMYLLGFSVVNV